jgi:4-hydroxyphenylpyruvate dioxygenase-like putative hemolysin
MTAIKRDLSKLEESTLRSMQKLAFEKLQRAGQEAGWGSSNAVLYMQLAQKELDEIEDEILKRSAT